MKNWLDKMERRFGRYAIRNLTMYLLAGYAIGYLLSFTMPQLLNYFTLEPALILKGQVWRLLSWVIIPPNDNIIFVIFMMLLYYSLGNTLESYWGAFRYNVYIFSGILFTVIGAFIVNVLIGEMSDRMVELGGTSILSETTEFIGAEHILARRGKTKEISDRIYQIVHDYEHAIKLVGHDIREGNPSPGNKEGGLTTLEEKSLGCIHKGGHSEVTAVYDYAKQVESKQGLVIMDTPGNDPSSVAAMVAGGCQIVVFSTGRGTPTGNPLAPVIKITGNKVTFANMSDNIDIDASPYIYGTKTMTELGDELMKEIKEVADGKLTKAEALGYTEMAIARVCNYM